MTAQRQKAKKVHLREPAPQPSAAAVGEDSPARGSLKRGALVFAVVLALALFAYSSSFRNGFTNWDDDKNVYENRYIREISLENLKVSFTKPLIGMYTPLVYLSYALDYRIKKLDPAVYHATNLLLHLINAALVMQLVWMITGRWEVAAIVSMVFAVHPMNAAAVTPVSVRSSLLYTLFYLGGLICYLRYVKHGKYEMKYLIGAGLLFLLSLLSKSAAVVFPLAMVLIDWYAGRRMDRKAILEKIPFFLLSLLFGILTILFREEAEHMGSIYSFALLERLFLVSYSILFYVVKLFFPLHLAPYYLYPDKVGAFLPLEYYLALPLLLILVWGIFRAKRHRKIIVFGTLFFLIHLVLVLKIVPMGSEMVCDRYNYIPAVGPLLIVAGVLYREKDRISERIPYFIPLSILLLAGCAALFSWMTYQRNAVWRNDFTLYNDMIEKSGNVPVAYNNRGIAYWKQGSHEKALLDFDKAVSIDPLAAEHFSNRGNIKKILGDYRGAMNDFNQAIHLHRKSAAAYCGRGDLKARLLDYDGALGDYETAIAVAPETAVAYYGRASVYVAREDYESALKDYSRAIELDPYRGGDVYYRRAYLYMIKEDFPSALRDYDQAIRFSPNHVDALLNRGFARFRMGDVSGAMEDYTRVIGLAPSDPGAYQNRGLIRWMQKDPAGACTDWRKAAGLGDKEAREKVAVHCR